MRYPILRRPYIEGLFNHVHLISENDEHAYKYVLMYVHQGPLYTGPEVRPSIGALRRLTLQHTFASKAQFVIWRM
jgi:hypothetical protein